MGLVVPGGAGPCPIPGQGCSGYYVECDTTRLVLDLGPGMLVELGRNVAPEQLDGVIILHVYVDHVLDLVALCWAVTHSPTPPATPIPARRS